MDFLALELLMQFKVLPYILVGSYWQGIFSYSRPSSLSVDGLFGLLLLSRVHSYPAELGLVFLVILSLSYLFA